MNDSNKAVKNILKQFVPGTHLDIAYDAQTTFEDQCRILFEKKKIPEIGWHDFHIERLVHDISSLDSNNFIKTCGVGEREGRIACSLVAKRHYGFSHGIGRSGNLEEVQPKAVGSTVLNQITNALLLDLVKLMGVASVKSSILVPMATGMTLSLCLLTLSDKRPNGKYVLWSRIDQKSCFKSILFAKLTPIIIDTVTNNDVDQNFELTTNIEEFKRKIIEIGAHNIVCIYSTTSCFAPRQCDKILELGKLAREYDIPHLVNNAYGLQSKWYGNKLEHTHKMGGRIDLFVQSTDKNLLVPVGGAIVCGFDEIIVSDVAKMYAGRASSSQSLDVFMTLLSLGKNGYLKLVSERSQVFQYLQKSLIEIGTDWEHNKYKVTNNNISIAFPLNDCDPENISIVGSMLFKRGICGARVISVNESNTISGYEFKCWGSHTSNTPVSYLNVAATLGMTNDDVDVFIKRFTKVLKKLKLIIVCDQDST